MKNLLLSIPDDDFDAFMKLLREFKSIKVNSTSDPSIPEWHKSIVEERMSSAVEEDFVPWETGKAKLKKK